MKTQQLGAIFLGIWVVFLWSAAKVVGKMSLESIPPYLLAAAVQVIALIVIAVYFWSQRRKVHTKFTASEIQLMIVSGLVAYAGANVFIMVGLQYVTGATAGLITAFNPIFAAILGYFLLKESLKVHQWLGVALVLGGIGIFLMGSLLGGTWLGLSLLVLAESAFALNAVLTRFVAKRYKKDTSLMSSLVGNLVGVVVLVPLAFVLDGTKFLPELGNPQILVSITVLGVIFALGGLMWGRVLNILPVAQASVLVNTMPFQVALLSVLFLSETLLSNQISGGVLVILGALLVESRLNFSGLFQLKLV